MTTSEASGVSAELPSYDDRFTDLYQLSHAEEHYQEYAQRVLRVFEAESRFAHASDEGRAPRLVDILGSVPDRALPRVADMLSYFSTQDREADSAVITHREALQSTAHTLAHYIRGDTNEQVDRQSTYGGRTITLTAPPYPEDPVAQFLIERGRASRRVLQKEALEGRVNRIAQRIQMSAEDIDRMRTRIGDWLQSGFVEEASNRLQSTEAVVGIAETLAGLVGLENEYVRQTENQARRNVTHRRGMQGLDFTLHPLSQRDPRIVGSEIFTQESREFDRLVMAEANTASDEHPARLWRIQRLADTLARARPQQVLNAVMARLQTADNGAEQLQRLNEAAQLQRDYEVAASLHPASLRQAIEVGITEDLVLPQPDAAIPIPRDLLMREDCPNAIQNMDVIQEIFLATLFGEHTSLRARGTDGSTAYESFSAAVWNIRNTACMMTLNPRGMLAGYNPTPLEVAIRHTTKQMEKPSP